MCSGKEHSKNSLDWDKGRLCCRCGLERALQDELRGDAGLARGKACQAVARLGPGQCSEKLAERRGSGIQSLSDLSLFIIQ